MSAQISYSVKDASHLRIVSVIASFDTDSNILPLYVRINGESYKILSCIEKERVATNISFQCAFQDGNMEKRITLIYFYTQHAWAIDLRKNGQ